MAARGARRGGLHAVRVHPADGEHVRTVCVLDQQGTALFDRDATANNGVEGGPDVHAAGQVGHLALKRADAVDQVRGGVGCRHYSGSK